MTAKKPRSTPVLHTYSYGEGPVVVLLHGFLSSSEYWKRVTELIERRHKVVTIDLLGFGKSPKPRKSQYDYQAHIESLNKTLAELGLRQFTLVGHSMGGLIGLRYAVTHPERVRKLVLVNMPVMIGEDEVKDEILKTSIIRSLALQPYVHRLTWPVVRLLFMSRLLPGQARAALSRHRYLFSHTAVSRFRSFRNVIANARVDIDLARLNVETVILNGLLDRRIYHENIQSLDTMSDSVSVESLPTGHHIPLVFPGAVVTAAVN